MNFHRALHVAVQRKADSILSLGADTAENSDIPRDGTRDMDAVGVVAQHADGAHAGQLADERCLNGQACRVIALDLDGAGRFDEHVAGQRGRARDADAVTIRAFREGAVQIAVLVGVGVFRDGVSDVDGPADRDIGGVAALDQDAGRAVGGLLHLDGGARIQIDAMAGIDGESRAAGDGDRAA
ncbi:hypothetical protein D3C80_1059910 [compost metagenome]